MPSIKQNLDLWNAGHEWKDQGDRWSTVWGGPSMQWFGTLYPRIQRYLPASIILEIAPGHGRWTQFLKNYCDRLIVVDLSPTCVDACRERFAGEQHIEYHLNDGKSLEMIADGSIDFAFSFDSLVHVEQDIINAYVEQLSRKLKANGVAFIHHSNLGEYGRLKRQQRWHPLIQKALKEVGLMEERTHWRAWSMSAGKMSEIAAQHCMGCLTQELIPWSTRRAQIDCLSVLVKNGSIWGNAQRMWRNPQFMQEAAYMGTLAYYYRNGKMK